MSETRPEAGVKRKKRRSPLFIVAIVGVIILVPLAGVFIGIAVPVYRNNRMKANEAAARRHLREIAAAQDAFLLAVGRYATFDELIEAAGLDSRFRGDAPAVDGYVFTMKLTAQTEGRPVFSINADPQQAGGFSATGRRHFFFASNVSGIRVNDERPASASDRPRE